MEFDETGHRMNFTLHVYNIAMNRGTAKVGDPGHRFIRDLFGRSVRERERSVDPPFIGLMVQPIR